MWAIPISTANTGCSERHPNMQSSTTLRTLRPRVIGHTLSREEVGYGSSTSIVT